MNQARQPSYEAQRRANEQTGRDAERQRLEREQHVADLDQPTTEREREQVRAAIAPGNDSRTTPPGSAEEAEALMAVSAAVGKLDRAAAARMATWVNAIASGTTSYGDSGPGRNVIARCLGDLMQAVAKHRDANPSPSANDVGLYMMVIGTDKLTRAELATYYSDASSEEKT